MSKPHVTLDEPTELLIISRVVGCFSVAINLVGVYFILFKSQNMKIYKWFLLNYVVGPLREAIF